LSFFSFFGSFLSDSSKKRCAYQNVEYQVEFITTKLKERRQNGVRVDRCPECSGIGIAEGSIQQKQAQQARPIDKVMLCCDHAESWEE
jgi:hypothetical protein